MFTTYLAYSPLTSRHSAHLHLMLRQLVGATARAVLFDKDGKDGSERTTRLMISAHPAMLAIAAHVARDFAAFVEPEGEKRPVPPVVAVSDGEEEKQGWGTEGREGAAYIDFWLHPAHIEGPVPLEEALRILLPKVCVVAGDADIFAERWLGRATRGAELPFRKLVVFPMFSSRKLSFARELGVPVTDAETLLKARLERGEVSGPSFWDRTLAEGEDIKLEPFVAFGAAIEHAIWSGDLGGYKDARR